MLRICMVVVFAVMMLACAAPPPSDVAGEARASVTSASASYEREQDVEIPTTLAWDGETRLELSCDDGFHITGGGCATGSARVVRSAAHGEGWICTSDTPPPFTLGVWVECAR